ncbi:MAG: glycosyltransferase family 2 protein [Aliarcobacter sp.]|jgi:glycosyltransferase involved in cell wall biosynthesis|nr:glycosyltransferase family 2 protein [Aliarcobacter sp.]
MNKIFILLSTYNGEKYLKEQLDSLFSQNYKNFKLIVRDDGSTDKTLEILKSYNIELLSSCENLGVKKSFESLLAYAYENSDAKYFMFCDQDDVWNEDKIEKTLNKMNEMEKLYKNTPILVHTDLEVVDENLHTINPSFMKLQNLNEKKNGLNNLLIQNTITGCTAMINRDLAKLCLPMSSNAIVHDWWVGLVASYFGKIGYLQQSTIKYRQHTSNTIGAKGFDIGFVLKSISKKVSLGRNISQSKGFFQQFKNELDEDTIEMLQEFISLEQKTWWQKRAVLLKYKLFKQGFIRNTGLFLKI